MKKLLVAAILVFATLAHAGQTSSALALKRLSEAADPISQAIYTGYVIGAMEASDRTQGYCIPLEANPLAIVEATREALAQIPDPALAALTAPEVLIQMFRGPFKCTAA